MTFFLISVGLGYPTLNRYDPGKIGGLFDPAAYAALVTDSQLSDSQLDLAHRVLVPYLARPIYWLVKNRLGSWNPAFFALLVVNSSFVASTAWLLAKIGRVITGEYATSVLAALLYLSNFVIANLHLSGNVDSSVDFVLIAITWSLLSGRWWALPILGIVGALGKETFVPISFVFVVTWYLAERKNHLKKIFPLAWIGAMAILGFATLLFVMSHQSPPYNPLSFAESRRVESGTGISFLPALIRCLKSHEFIFAFGWLIPLGLPRLRSLPVAWVTGATCAAITALALGAYNDALGNTIRPMFSTLGPMLSLSASLFLVGTSARKQI